MMRNCCLTCLLTLAVSTQTVLGQPAYGPPVNDPNDPAVQSQKQSREYTPVDKVFEEAFGPECCDEGCPGQPCWYLTAANQVKSWLRAWQFGSCQMSQAMQAVAAAMECPHRLNPEEERLQRFWHDYYNSIHMHYGNLDRIDWVEYYKNHGYKINTGSGAGCNSDGACDGVNRIMFSPVFVSPSMQFAVSPGGAGIGAAAGAAAGCFAGEKPAANNETYNQLIKRLNEEQDLRRVLQDQVISLKKQLQERGCCCAAAHTACCAAAQPGCCGTSGCKCCCKEGENHELLKLFRNACEDAMTELGWLATLPGLPYPPPMNGVVMGHALPHWQMAQCMGELPPHYGPFGPCPVTGPTVFSGFAPPHAFSPPPPFPPPPPPWTGYGQQAQNWGPPAPWGPQSPGFGQPVWVGPSPCGTPASWAAAQSIAAQNTQPVAFPRAADVYQDECKIIARGGAVHLTTANIEARCSTVNFSGHRERVVLEGDVHLVYRKGNETTRIEAPRVVVNLNQGTFTVESGNVCPSQGPVVVPCAPVCPSSGPVAVPFSSGFFH